MKTIVYQTVESTPDKTKLLKEAPFLCEDDPKKLKEWLGSGFYLWDTFIELAYWWGKYIIRIDTNIISSVKVHLHV